MNLKEHKYYLWPLAYMLVCSTVAQAQTDPVVPLPAYIAEMSAGAAPFIVPIDNPKSPPGEWAKAHTHPVFNVSRRKCCTIIAPTDTPVRAMADGAVLHAGWYGGYGKVVILSHGSKYSTLYSHLKTYFVSPGQDVKQGWLVGLVGSTGYSTRSKLLFEIRKNGKPLSDSESLKNVILSQQ